MKRILSVLLVILCFQSHGIYANVSEKTSLEELLNKTMMKLDSNASPDRFTTCIAELKRIRTMYPKEWTPYYYISFYEIQQTLSNLSNDNEELLNDAIANIDLLKKNKKADQSEISTIEGYYYYAIIAKDPAKNGQIYYKNVLEAYQKALKYNPENPRAQLLLTIFKLNMAAFTGNNDNENIYNKLVEIDKIFQKENNDFLKPFWGKDILVATKERLKKS